jgi:hypothetical protein
MTLGDIAIAHSSLPNNMDMGSVLKQEARSVDIV